MGISSKMGFTLIELLVAVSVAAIVLAFGVPSFQGMIRDSRLAAQSSRLLTTLNLARSEAIKRGTQVTVCKADLSTSPPKCDTSSCNSATGSNCWEEGWLVFADANRNGILNDSTDTSFCAGGDCTIRVFDALPKGFTMRSGAHVANWIAYQSPGTGLGSGPGNLVNDTFKICAGKDKSNAKSVAINSVGRARVYKGATACP
jgi:type IV fimbrial biogenesis protein FimT